MPDCSDWATLGVLRQSIFDSKSGASSFGSCMLAPASRVRNAAVPASSPIAPERQQPSESWSIFRVRLRPTRDDSPACKTPCRKTLSVNCPTVQFAPLPERIPERTLAGPEAGSGRGKIQSVAARMWGGLKGPIYEVGIDKPQQVIRALIMFWILVQRYLHSLRVSVKRNDPAVRNSY